MKAMLLLARCVANVPTRIRIIVIGMWAPSYPTITFVLRGNAEHREQSRYIDGEWIKPAHRTNLAI